MKTEVAITWRELFAKLEKEELDLPVKIAHFDFEYGEQVIQEGVMLVADKDNRPMLISVGSLHNFLECVEI